MSPQENEIVSKKMDRTVALEKNLYFYTEEKIKQDKKKIRKKKYYLYSHFTATHFSSFFTNSYGFPHPYIRSFSFNSSHPSLDR